MQIKAQSGDGVLILFALCLGMIAFFVLLLLWPYIHWIIGAAVIILIAMYPGYAMALAVFAFLAMIVWIVSHLVLITQGYL